MIARFVQQIVAHIQGCARQPTSSKNIVRIAYVRRPVFFWPKRTRQNCQNGKPRRRGENPFIPSDRACQCLRTAYFWQNLLQQETAPIVKRRVFFLSSGHCKEFNINIYIKYSRRNKKKEENEQRQRQRQEDGEEIPQQRHV